MSKIPSFAKGICATTLLFVPLSASALTVTSYEPAVHDRFSSGFPAAPVPNANPSFVGAPYDWSGLGWTTSAAGSTGFFKNLGLLSPIHFLTAQHYEYTDDATAGIRLIDSDGDLRTASAESVANLGHGIVLTNKSITNPDLALGRLSSPVAAPVPVRYGVLDLHNASGSNTLSNYNGLSLILSGRGASTNGSPRLGEATVDAAGIVGSDSTQAILRTNWSGVQLQLGDSGSPAFHGWTNPNGGAELTLLGVNSAVDSVNGFNFISLLATTGAMAAANAQMTADGYALRVVGNPSHTWVGSSSTSIGNRGAWGLSAPNNAPSDRFVLFDGATAGNNRVVTVDSAANLRGLYFRETAGSNLGFTFSGTSTLTIGRGGITNYDDSRQVINAPILLGDHQYWSTGPGGVTTGNINTNGRLLEIAGGAAPVLINGVVSGSGGLALSGGELELAGNNSYIGKTWVHEGRLIANGLLLSSEEVVLGPKAELAGSGGVSVVRGSGSIHPGQSAGILAASSVNPAQGLDFSFEFFAPGSPAWGNASNSTNDVLRLTGASPFAAPLGVTNTIRIFIGSETVSFGQTYRGGFFTDAGGAFLPQIQGGSFSYFLADPSGSVSYGGMSYSLYSGPLTFSLSTEPEVAAFSSGSVNGHVMAFTAIPEPSTWAFFAGLGVLGLACVRRRATAR